MLTNNGVTITIEDSIVTVNGKSNSGLTTTALATFTLKAGTYKISGGSDSATGADFFMRLGKAADDSYISYSASTAPVNEFTLASDTNVKLTILLNASVGQVTNVKFYPMICDKSIYDQSSSFVPYGAPNYDLTYQLSTLQNKAVQISDTIGSTGNFNSMTKTGVYKFTATPANAPISCYGILTVLASESYISQTVQSMSDSTTSGTFYRYSVDNGSTWSDWIGKIVSSLWYVQPLAADTYWIISSCDIPAHSMVRLHASIQQFSTTSGNPTGILISSAESVGDISPTNTLCKSEQAANTVMTLGTECLYLNDSSTTIRFYIYARTTATDRINFQLIQENFGRK